MRNLGPSNSKQNENIILKVFFKQIIDFYQFICRISFILFETFKSKSTSIFLFIYQFEKKTISSFYPLTNEHNLTFKWLLWCFKTQNRLENFKHHVDNSLLGSCFTNLCPKECYCTFLKPRNFLSSFCFQMLIYLYWNIEFVFIAIYLYTYHILPD